MSSRPLQPGDHRKKIVSPEEQQKIIKTTHEFAHQGQKTTEDKIRQQYKWKGIRQQVIDFIQTCLICQQYQQKGKSQAPLQPIEPPVNILERWGIDVIGPLPATICHNKYILVLVEHLSKWPEAFPMQLADALTITGHLHEITRRYGAPKELISDQGTEFINKLVSTYAKIHGIQLKQTTAYYPQTNGMTEQMNQTIKKGLAKSAKQQD